MREKLYILIALLSIIGCSRPKKSHNIAVIKGRVTYDRVSVKIESGGVARLDYSNIIELPSRGVLVKAMDVNGSIVATTSTDMDGRYSFRVPINRDIKVRVHAEMFKDGYWDVNGG